MVSASLIASLLAAPGPLSACARTTPSSPGAFPAAGVRDNRHARPWRSPLRWAASGRPLIRGPGRSLSAVTTLGPGCGVHDPEQAERFAVRVVAAGELVEQERAGGRRARSARGVAYRGQQRLEVLTAGAARAQVRRDAGVPLLRRDARGDQVDVDMQHLHRLRAADIARIGMQEAVQRQPAVHERPESSSSRYPLAARAARSLRRASNIIL